MSFGEILSLAVFAADQIRKLVKSPVVAEGDNIVNAIAGIFDAVESAAGGHVTPQMAQAQIDGLVAAIRSNDAAADAALDQRFPTGSG